MAVTVSQILVKTVHLDRLLKALASYLARWAKTVKSSWPDVPFLGTDAARTTRVLPPLDGWCCVVDPDPYRVDLDLAQALSAALACRTIALELRGGELVLTQAACEGGRVLDDQRDPPEAFVPHGTECAMPLYSDVTQEALRSLQSEGVPREYWFVRFDDFLEGASTDAQDAYWVDEIVTRPHERDAVKPSTRTLFVVKRYQGSAGFRPDVEGLGVENRRQFVEIRTLFGAPQAHHIDSLLEIERADTNRLLRRFMGQHENDVPEVLFEYTCPGTAEGELSRLLDRRRAQFLHRRPTERQFLRIALGAAASEHADWLDVRPDGFGLAFRRTDPLSRAPGTRGEVSSTAETIRAMRRPQRAATDAALVETRVDLAAPYADYIAGRLVAESPEAAVRSYLAKAADSFDRSSLANGFAAFAAGVQPGLVGPEEGARLKASGVATRPLGHNVQVVLVCPVGDGTALVEEGDLERWGVSFQHVLKAARNNMGRAAANEERSYVDLDLVPGKKVLADMSGNDPATRILLPNLTTLLSGRLAAGEVLCAIPDLDSFFATQHTDEAMRAELRAFARERMMAAESPLTAELFIVRHDSVEEA
jgi:hypothetical protein